MGDFRANIKIIFEMGDFKDETDMWINWSPDSSGYPGVDQRVLDFFERAGEKGVADILDKIYEPEVNRVDTLAEIRSILDGDAGPSDRLDEIERIIARAKEQ